MKTIGGFVVGACTVLGLVAGVVALGVKDEEPDVNQAEQFLSSYFRSAPTDPALTWALLTDGYVENRALSTGEPFNFEVYAAYFASFSTIRVSAVRPSGQFDGWFDADVTYMAQNKEDSTSHQVFQIVCPPETRYPLFTCDVTDMRINRVVINQSKLDADRAAEELKPSTCPSYRGECETFLGVEVIASTFYGPAAAWSSTLRISNDGDYPTRGCFAVEATGSVKRFSLQPGSQRDLTLLLQPDPVLPPQSLTDPDPPLGNALLDTRCDNVRDLPTGLRLVGGD